MTTKSPADTIGLKPATIDRLWKQFRTAIDATYTAADHNDPARHLRDYAENVGLVDKLETLVHEETRTERQHRAHDGMYGRPVRRPVSCVHAAKILLLGQAGKGAELSEMPESTDWLTYRRTAVEANLIGFLIRAHVSPEWIAACAALDYAEIMKD